MVILNLGLLAHTLKKALQKYVRLLAAPQGAGACAVPATMQRAGSVELNDAHERPENVMKMKNLITLWDDTIMFGTPAQGEVADRHSTKNQAEQIIMKVNN